MDPLHERLAGALGRRLAEVGCGVVYGGGSRGLMGALAKAALAAGGDVYGVIPKEMEEREWAFRGVTELFLTDGMHERKARMAELSDAFLVLPGGIGTLEELFEVYTWRQLGFHHKPVLVLDDRGYYAPVLAMLDQMVEAGFLGAQARGLLEVVRSPEQALVRLGLLDSTG